MEKDFWDKIKTNIMAGAQTSITKIGEATRTGKIHLKIMTENRKLDKTYADLGREAFIDAKKNPRSKFSQKPEIKKMVVEIKSCLGKIKEFEDVLKAESGSPKKPAGKSAKK
jgi:hypothetical protein